MEKFQDPHVQQDILVVVVEVQYRCGELAKCLRVGGVGGGGRGGGTSPAPAPTYDQV